MNGRPRWQASVGSDENTGVSISVRPLNSVARILGNLLEKAGSRAALQVGLFTSCKARRFWCVQEAPL